MKKKGELKFEKKINKIEKRVGKIKKRFINIDNIDSFIKGRVLSMMRTKKCRTREMMSKIQEFYSETSRMQETYETNPHLYELLQIPYPAIIYDKHSPPPPPPQLPEAQQGLPSKIEQDIDPRKSPYNIDRSYPTSPEEPFCSGEHP